MEDNDNPEKSYMYKSNMQTHTKKPKSLKLQGGNANHTNTVLPFTSFHVIIKLNRDFVGHNFAKQIYYKICILQYKQHQQTLYNCHPDGVRSPIIYLNGKDCSALINSEDCFDLCNQLQGTL